MPLHWDTSQWDFDGLITIVYNSATFFIVPSHWGVGGQRSLDNVGPSGDMVINTGLNL